MNRLDMGPEVVQMVEAEISALGMLTPDPLAALLSLPAPSQMLVIDVIVHDSRSADIARNAGVEGNDGGWATVYVPFQEARLYGQAGFDPLLNANTPGRLLLIAESRHETDRF
ncbi:unnamed protein product [Clonostachys rosea f. rosea IK726]|uniref:Uncharacterized protein n=1 Tax=Clonostachys rosea f. rosea IK726 TaxID=1349383 RepID=A0ACA9U7R0_BIOOC|nr:unnamed protein product [Clonostachys rosea f. rosea IK726]